MKSINVSGQWWLPETKESSIGGVLSFSPSDGGSLALIGSLMGDAFFERIMGESDMPSIAVVQGITTEGDRVTLLDNHIMNSRIVSGGYPTQILHPQFIFVGGHFNSATEISSTKISASYSFLQDWYGRSGFAWKWMSQDATDKDVVTLSYRHPESIVGSVPNGDITIKTNLSANLSRYDPTLRQEVFIEFSRKEPLDADSWIKLFVSPIQGFLSFAVDKPNSITHISLFRNVKQIADKNENKEAEINMFFEPVFNDIKPGKELRNDEMLFTLDDITDFGTTINAWLNMFTRLEPALNLYLGSMYRPAGYMDSRFLQNVQTIEVLYHLMRAKEGRRVPLSKLLGEMFDASAELMLLIVDSKERFVAETMKTRNYFIHYDPALRQWSDNERVYWLNEALRLLLSYTLLREMGFSKEKCTHLFDRNKRFRAIRSLAPLRTR